MAAGEGSRLRPLTERWPKPVLPIDGRAGDRDAAARAGGRGHQRAFVVTATSPSRSRRCSATARASALDVRSSASRGAHGSADAVRRALAAGAEAPLLVDRGGHGLQHGRRRGASSRRSPRPAPRARSPARRDPPPVPAHRDGLRVVNGLVEKLVDDDPANGLGSAPLWGLGPSSIPLLDGLSGPPFELADVVQAGAGVEGADSRASRSGRRGT